MTANTAATSGLVQTPKRTSGLEDEIRLRAYELYEQRGGEHGYDVEDWLRAEEEVRHTKRSRRIAA